MSEVLQESKHIEKADTAAEFVFGLMQQDREQPQLELLEGGGRTAADNGVRGMKDNIVKDLEDNNPDNIIISGSELDKYRYIAAFLGAGFHMSQYDEVTYRFNDDADAGRFVIGYWHEKSGHVQKRYSRSNKMVDEVNDELFTQHVPTTGYHLSTGMYITSEEDIKKIFSFDYSNLQACRELNMDLLYERENM